MQVQARGVFAAHDDGESVVEAERRADVEIEAVAVGVVDGLVDGGGIVRGRLIQDGGERRAGVFGIEIHLPREHGLLADDGAAEIEPAVDAQAGDALRSAATGFRRG